MRMLRAVVGCLTLLAIVAPRAKADFEPDPASVQRYGPAYRFPQAGWVVLHIEGQPYERGYQHGRLMAPEIAGYLRCFAAMLCSKAPAESWQSTRRLTNALFVRKFEKEFLEEMKGIADGASAAGARFDNRPIDLVDIVALNCWPEIETLDSALEATPTGLEGIRFPNPQPRAKPEPRPEHCSAFAATGPATADGKIVFGHITMFSLYAANFYNVWIDVKPARGHRFVMCAYPGAMQSGMDYYLNDAGILIAETTIGQTRFNIQGQTEASRIRQAIQYAENIDQAVDILKKDNNGLYTNEWLLGDINTNEIALFELGTHKSKLHRSSKKEWVGGTEGFYWGCNNTKDLELRLETVPSVEGRPVNVVFRPSDRDIAWQRLFQQHKGKIDASFGKLAFTTPPIAAFPSLDAKFTTTDLAKNLQSWALFGPPLGRTWQPTQDERQRFPEIKPLVSNPWTILHANAPAKSTPTELAVDLAPRKDHANADNRPLLHVPAWHGTLLPQGEGDIWLATAFAEYQRYVARENALRTQNGGKLTQRNLDELAVDLFAWQGAYLAAVRKRGDVPLTQIKAELTSDDWYKLAAGKGVLALHKLRERMGDPLFEKTMDAFGSAHAGKKVTTSQFLLHVEKTSPKGCDVLTRCLESGPLTDLKPAFSIISFQAEPDQTLIVYGTGDEVHANRETAESLQQLLRRSLQNHTLPIKADKEVTEGELKTHHLLLIGRPGQNSVVGRFQKHMPVVFGSGSFKVAGKTYAHAGSAIIAAADNPLNERFSMVLLAGLSAEATLHTPAKCYAGRDRRPAEVVVLANEDRPLALVVRSSNHERR